MKFGAPRELIGTAVGKKQAKPLATFKVILPLRGFAIFFVVLAHAAIMMLAIEVSHKSPEALSVFALGPWRVFSFGKSAILEFCRFSVPLFLFLSGYYLLSTPRTWKSIWSACRKLLLPMLFWSLVALAISWRKGSGGWGPGEFAVVLLTGTGQMGYFFIVLIVQLYVLSYWLIPAIAKRPFLVLLAAFALEMLVQAWDYAYLLSSMALLQAPGWLVSAGPLPEVVFPRFVFPFVLGIWAGSDSTRFRGVLIERFPLVTGASAAALFLLLFERGILCGYGAANLSLDPFASTALSWVEWKGSTFLWSVAAIFLFFGFFVRRIPMKPLLDTLGKYSLQIFLLHGFAMTTVHRVLYKILDLSLYTGFLGVMLLLLTGLVLPILGAKLAQRTLPPGLRTLLTGS